MSSLELLWLQGDDAQDDAEPSAGTVLRAAVHVRRAVQPTTAGRRGDRTTDVHHDHEPKYVTHTDSYWDRTTDKHFLWSWLSMDQNEIFLDFMVLFGRSSKMRVDGLTPVEILDLPLTYNLLAILIPNQPSFCMKALKELFTFPIGSLVWKGKKVPLRIGSYPGKVCRFNGLGFPSGGLGFPTVPRNWYDKT